MEEQAIELAQMIEWGFKAVVSGGVIYGVRVISNLQKSIETLNIKVAVVVERTATHKEALIRHDERIKLLEITPKA